MSGWICSAAVSEALLWQPITCHALTLTFQMLQQPWKTFSTIFRKRQMKKPPDRMKNELLIGTVSGKRSSSSLPVFKSKILAEFRA